MSLLTQSTDYHQTRSYSSCS